MTNKELVNWSRDINGVVNLNEYRYYRDLHPEVQPTRKAGKRKFLTDKERVAKNSGSKHSLF